MPCKDTSVLLPEFRNKLAIVLTNCEARGFILKPYFTQRTSQEQAVLWRQGRPLNVITQKVQMLEACGATFLAGVLKAAMGPGGKIVTNAIPGYSWHEW